MISDLEKMLESKRAYREQLASLPIAKKLRILDALRERELAIRGRMTRTGSASSTFPEKVSATDSGDKK